MPQNEDARGDDVQQNPLPNLMISVEFWDPSVSPGHGAFWHFERRVRRQEQPVLEAEQLQRQAEEAGSEWAVAAIFPGTS